MLNASGATNFVYEVTGLTDSQMEEVNAIDTPKKIIDRIEKIKEFGGTMKFVKAKNECFSDNLSMIDSRMEEMISEVLVYSYTENEVDCRTIIEKVADKNPLSYNRIEAYSYKFKQFLCAKALGMDPSKEWSGEDDANGGYIVAKADGEVLAYHLYNRDKFKQYLYDNTKLERASTSRHDYASIYKEGGKMLFNLNLQIRFK